MACRGNVHSVNEVGNDSRSLEAGPGLLSGAVHGRLPQHRLPRDYLGVAISTSPQPSRLLPTLPTPSHPLAKSNWSLLVMAHRLSVEGSLRSYASFPLAITCSFHLCSSFTITSLDLLHSRHKSPNPLPLFYLHPCISTHLPILLCPGS